MESVSSYNPLHYYSRLRLWCWWVRVMGLSLTMPAGWHPFCCQQEWSFRSGSAWSVPLVCQSRQCLSALHQKPGPSGRRCGPPRCARWFDHRYQPKRPYLPAHCRTSRVSRSPTEQTTTFLTSEPCISWPISLRLGVLAWYTTRQKSPVWTLDTPLMLSTDLATGRSTDSANGSSGNNFNISSSI